MANNSLTQKDKNKNDGYFASYRKNFHEKKEDEGYINKKVRWAIIFGVLAVLIGGFTYGLGTVTLASSVFLGLFGSWAVNDITDSLLENYTPAERKNNFEGIKALKKRFIAALVIGLCFAVTAVLIGALTFGAGIIPLGTFAAAALTTAFSWAALSNLFNAYKFRKALKYLKMQDNFFNKSHQQQNSDFTEKQNSEFNQDFAIPFVVRNENDIDMFNA